MLRSKLFWFSAITTVALAVLTFWPQADLWVSALFYGQDAFTHEKSLFLKGMTRTVFYGARALALAFLIAALFAYFKRETVYGRDGKGWLFLLLCLLIGPGLFANVMLKDHWGRARPHQTSDFGGAASFTPAFVLSDACARNCSFVSGDGAFGFFLPAFAYGARPHKRRRVFWTAMAAGAVISAGRIAMGAHFLSDVLGAMVLSLGVCAALHALFYGAATTRRHWRTFFAD